MPSIALTPVASGQWRTTAGAEWSNPRGGLWGGWAIGVCVRVLEAEPEATGEPLSLTLTYAAALPAGDIEVRTRRVRQGRSIGVWEIELAVAGSGEIGVHAMMTMAVRPETPAFAFAEIPRAPAPEGIGATLSPISSQHPSQTLFDRRMVDPSRPRIPGDSCTLTWVRAREAPFDAAILGMLCDSSPPPMMSALKGITLSTTLSLTVYFHATAAELAEVGDDFVLVEYDGRVGGHGASDERSSYWRRDGKLLATSEQLAWYRATG